MILAGAGAMAAVPSRGISPALPGKDQRGLLSTCAGLFHCTCLWSQRVTACAIIRSPSRLPLLTLPSHQGPGELLCSAQQDKVTVTCNHLSTTVLFSDWSRTDHGDGIAKDYCKSSSNRTHQRMFLGHSRRNHGRFAAVAGLEANAIRKILHKVCTNVNWFLVKELL